MSSAGYQEWRLALQLIAAGSNVGMNLYSIPR
jgi:hypothetical protein